MYLKNKIIKRYIALPVVLSYITSCHKLNIVSNNNQNKASTQSCLDPFASNQEVKTLQVLAGKKVFAADILAFFFPTPSGSESLPTVGVITQLFKPFKAILSLFSPTPSQRESLPIELLKDPYYNKLVDEQVVMFLEKYLNNQYLYYNLVNHLNENSMVATAWEAEGNPGHKFVLKNMIFDLNNFLKAICLEILKNL